MASKTPLRFAEFAGPFFGFILQLRASTEFGDPMVLRQRIHHFLDEFERNTRREGQDPEAIFSAKFALAAFMDETIMRAAEWQHQGTWVTNPLCMEIFQRGDAGNEFFNRLEDIRRDASKNPGLLEIYYLCMALGFKGKYAIFETDKLRVIKDETYKVLQSLIGEPNAALSLKGLPKEEMVEKMGGELPIFKIAGGLAGIAIIVWVILFWLSGNAVDQALNTF